jgi:hypothetical protein
MRDATEMFQLPERTEEALTTHVEAFVERPTFVGFPRRAGATEIIVDRDSVVKMYVNHDRWVGDCPHCNGGVTGIPGVANVTCLDCGRKMGARWPRVDLAEVERILSYREEMQRNMDPDQTLNDLKAENVTRGVRIV